jgi:phage terminase small subunit
MALTAKAMRFGEEYIIDLNATQAAIRAGYSEKTAYSIGQENLKKPEIQEYIQKLMEERSKRTEITADLVLKEYAKLGLADIKNYLSYKTVMTKVGTDEDGQDIFDYAPIIDLKDSEEVDGAPISEVSISKDGTFKFKFHDKKGALDSMAKHLGMFTDKIEHSGAIAHEHKHDLKKLSPKELADLEHILTKTADSG